MCKVLSYVGVDFFCISILGEVFGDLIGVFLRLNCKVGWFYWLLHPSDYIHICGRYLKLWAYGCDMVIPLALIQNLV